MEAIAESTSGLVNVSFTDWEGTRRAYLEGVPLNATVAEILDEAARTMDLAADTSYRALFDGRNLNRGETLDEIGITSDVEMEIIPEVSAGGGGAIEA